MTAADLALRERAALLLALCRARGLLLATAESCTGGLVAAALTAPPGASVLLDRGFVTYSNEAKAELLGVPPGLIAAMGAVSEPVARRMARGALQRSRAGLAVSVTGIAGPDGGVAGKPVGTVWFGLAWANGEAVRRRRFGGDRDAVRLAAAAFALDLLVSAAGERTIPSPARRGCGAPAW